MKKTNLKRMTQLSLLSALIVLMGFTVLGSIPLGGPIVATTVQIPVVIGAILLGTKAGMFLGGVFGLVSFIYFTVYAYPTSFVFSAVHAPALANGNVLLGIWFAVCSLIICFVPRILIGFVSGRVYKWLAPKNKTAACAAAGALGAATNTILVLGFIMLFFGTQYETAVGTGQALLAIVGASLLTNGIPEAIVTAIIVTAVARALMAVRKH